MAQVQTTSIKSPLLGSGFLGITISQCFGAFNDNAFRFLIVFALGTEHANDTAKYAQIVTLTGVLLVLPFLLFSSFAGQISDRYSKRSVCLWSKVAELVLMIAGLFAFRWSHPMVFYALVFLMGTQSTFFSPAKYGLLAEMLPAEKLSKGNGVFEMMHYLCIIVGMGFVVVFIAYLPSLTDESLTRPDQFWPASTVLIIFALIGTLAVKGIPFLPAASPDRELMGNPVRELLANFRIIYQSRLLWFTVLGIAFFWFVGPLLQSTILLYHSVWPELENAQGYLVLTVSIGIGLGSVCAGLLSGGKVELGLVPIGSVGMFVGCFMVSFLEDSYLGTFVWLGVSSVCAGFFIVPLNSLLQYAAPPDKKGGIIACSNFLSFTFMIIAQLVYYLLSTKIDPPTMFAFIGFVLLLASVYIVWLLPDVLVRFVLWVVTHSLYRIRVSGRIHIPQDGAALIVSNHVSWVDGILIQAAVDRPIRFLVESGYAHLPVLSQLARLMKIIPISSRSGPKEMLKAVRTARDALATGELVCVFAEGQITRTGGLMPFRRGFQRMTKGLASVPIVPAYLDHVWGSIFSFQGGRFLSKWPKQVPYPVSVAFGSSMPSNTVPWRVRQAVQEVGSKSVELRKTRQIPLHRQFVRMAKAHPFRPCIADSAGDGMSYGKTLVTAMILKRSLRRRLGSHKMVGVVLPTGSGAVLANIAMMMMKRVPININYTASLDAVESVRQQCEITQIVTSRKWIEKIETEVKGDLVFLEDLEEKVTVVDRLRTALMFWPFCLLPCYVLESWVLRLRKHSIDDLAAVIFSSGSTGEPKGIMLSQHNIVSNVEAVVQVIDPRPRDVLIGTLPFFHSFGLTVTLWMPLLVGARAVYHPNPLEAKEIGDLCRQHSGTLLISTPTFLRNYLRRCTAQDFESIRLLLCGAEKLPLHLEEAFEEKFGIRPYEGYGCTELAPVVSTNIPDYEQGGIRQIGNKSGTVGHPLPGIVARIVDRETGESLPPGAQGVLNVLGPNVMTGYLDQPEATQAVIRDGWYNTGDIATLDEDGFITITDRINRFSKIAGEMIPHIQIEQTLHEIMSVHEQLCAVTGITDEHKGEQLVVLHLPLPEEWDPTILCRKMRERGLPNLWIPMPRLFYAVDAIPVLGSGKLDIRRLREIAMVMSAKTI